MSFVAYNKIECEQRKFHQKRSAAYYLNNGKVLVELYKKDGGHEKLLCEAKRLDVLIQDTCFMTRIAEISIDGKKYNAIAKNIHFDALYTSPRNIEFAEVEADNIVKYTVPVQIINRETCVGIKRGGKITQFAYEAKLKCKAKDMIEKIVLDIEATEKGTKVFVSDSKSINKDKVTIDQDLLILKISGREEEAKTDEAKK